MNCEEFRSAILAGREDAALHAHEQACAACRSRAPDLRAANASLSDPSVWEEPSPELAFQVEELIRGAHRQSSPRRASLWMRRLQIAAAAVVVVAAGLVFVTVRNSPPDWDVALPATDLAPNAMATVMGWNEEGGTRMVLEIEGLDPAPPGFVYEFWLSEGPIHISAGTFSSAGQVELWSGVARADFPRLWITLEAIDEDESPSGLTVLDTGRDA